MESCPKCGIREIDTVSLSGGKILSYASSRVRAQFHKNNVKPRVCLNCGYAELYIDQDYIQRIRSR